MLGIIPKRVFIRGSIIGLKVVLYKVYGSGVLGLSWIPSKVSFGALFREQQTFKPSTLDPRIPLASWAFGLVSEVGLR